jgi:hypothetical protein
MKKSVKRYQKMNLMLTIDQGDITSSDSQT